MNPRVSVVVPTRDRLADLQRALAAVAAQDFNDFEVLVVDDGSRDGTAEWVRQNRPEVHLLALEQSVGAAGARNRGVERSRGEFIAFLDDDDVWRRGYLSAQVRNLDDHPGAALSYAGHLEIEWPSGRTSRPDTTALLSYASPLVRLGAEAFIHTMSVVVCRREVFARVGGFDERLTIVHDFDWYCRVLRDGGTFVHEPDFLVGRATPGGLVTRHRRWFEEEYEVLTRLFAGHDDGRLVRASRSLYFARLGLARGDFTFGATRLGAAFLQSPRWTISVATRRLIRRARAAKPQPWEAAA